jgi:DNA-binding transcriptional regulator GbsR (MarR family)
MNPAMLRQYRQKKKRAVDPNAPPRPTLLGQVKELKDTREALQHHEQLLAFMQQKVDQLERRLRAQTDYLNALHQKLLKK